MAPYAPNGFAPGGRALVNGSRLNGSPNGSRGPSNAASVSLALDNMIRSQLKVSDPRNPKEIAQALLSYYKDLPQAAAITEEAQGLPFLQAVQPTALPPPRPTSSDAEFRIAQGDVEKALNDLANNPLTNDITPEMNGWGDSIRTAISQGYVSSRQGLDPSQRDMVFAVRRQLGEYGRLARFVGSLSPGMTQNYRRLGQGLDEVSAVLLVMLGESLASVGFASGYYLLQVPLAELQQRRDAVVFALRNFIGGAQEAYGPDDWPRGIEAYRLLYDWLERQGQGDLRSLLIENEIAQVMDALISRAQNGTAEGLRALGVTAQLDIERFRRMAIVAPGAMSRDGRFHRSPPLEAFLQALELFADTFKPSGGLRLLRIARPPILFYGIYNPNLLEDDRDLVDLIMVRGNLGTIFDGLFPAAGAHSVETRVLLDMLLLELDRGIDLLSLAASANDAVSASNKRAVAYWFIIQVILNLVTNGSFYIAPVRVAKDLSNRFTTNAPPAGGGNVVTIADPGLPGNLPATTVYIASERRLGNAVLTLSGLFQINAIAAAGGQCTINVPAGIDVGQQGQAWGGEVTLIYFSARAPLTKQPIATYAVEHPPFLNILSEVARAYQTGTAGIPELDKAIKRYSGLEAVRLPQPNSLDWQRIGGALEELRVNLMLERRWQDLVRTMAPEAGDQEAVFELLKLVIEQATGDAEQTAKGGVPVRVPYEQPLPPQFEQTLAEIARPRRYNVIP
jgi:hypothetical protein